MFRRSKYAIGWKGSVDKKRDAAVRVDRRGHLELAKGAGGPSDGFRQPPPIQTIKQLDRALQVPGGIHVGRPKQDRGDQALEARDRSMRFEERQLARSLGVKRASVGGVQPKGAITIRQILALPDYTVEGRRIDKKRLAKNLRAALKKTGKR